MRLIFGKFILKEKHMMMKLPASTAIAMAVSLGAATAEPTFSDYDQNRDGLITIDEYDAFVLAPFDRIDSNGDLKISHEEALVVARMRAQGTAKKPRRMVARLFARYDSNEDQFLTALELGYGGSGEFFNLRDGNFDGEITLAEWADVAQVDEAGIEDPEPESNEDTVAEAAPDSSSQERVRVPTDPSEPENSNLDKLLPGDATATASPLSGSWLFDFRR